MQFEESRRVTTRMLRGPELRIGRDPTSDLIVDYANVSRHHAVVRALGDRNLVQDLGSANGVQVNGVPIGGKPRLLEQGDLIQLSDQVLLLYEEGPFSSSTPWVVTAIAALVLLAATLGLYMSVRATRADSAPTSIQSGPKRNGAGTHRGMPQSNTPQPPGLEQNFRPSPARWYAGTPGRSSGDATLGLRRAWAPRG